MNAGVAEGPVDLARSDDFSHVAVCMESLKLCVLWSSVKSDLEEHETELIGHVMQASLAFLL